MRCLPKTYSGVNFFSLEKNLIRLYKIQKWYRHDVINNFKDIIKKRF